MSTRNALVALSLAFAFGAGTAVAETPGLGRPISEADIAAWNIEVLPDGTGLPPGSGTAVQGAAIYSQKCAMCHGENGVNPPRGYLPMVGPSKFDRIDTMKTVPYYKYATTLFDVIRRSMPYQMPKTLTNEELYALSAYHLGSGQDLGPKRSSNCVVTSRWPVSSRPSPCLGRPDPKTTDDPSRGAPFIPSLANAISSPSQRRPRLGKHGEWVNGAWVEGKGRARDRIEPRHRPWHRPRVRRGGL